MNDGPEPLRVELGRRAIAVAKGIALAPVVVFGVLFIVTLPGGLALLVADWAFSKRAAGLETAVVTVLIAGTFAGGLVGVRLRRDRLDVPGSRQTAARPPARRRRRCTTGLIDGSTNRSHVLPIGVR